MKRLYPDGCGYEVKKRVETVFKGKRGGIFYMSESGNKTYIRQEREPIYQCDCYHPLEEGAIKVAETSSLAPLRKIRHTEKQENVVFNLPKLQVLTPDSILIPFFVTLQQICQLIEGHILLHENIQSLRVRILCITKEQREEVQAGINKRFDRCFPIQVVE